jgi:hypothetical protein
MWRLADHAADARDLLAKQDQNIAILRQAIADANTRLDAPRSDRCAVSARYHAGSGAMAQLSHAKKNRISARRRATTHCGRVAVPTTHCRDHGSVCRPPGRRDDRSPGRGSPSSGPTTMTKKPKAPISEADKLARVFSAIRDLGDSEMRVALGSAITPRMLLVGKRQPEKACLAKSLRGREGDVGAN